MPGPCPRHRRGVLNRAGDELETRTGHDAYDAPAGERILEAEAERIAEELRPEHMLDDREERERLGRLALIKRVDRLSSHVTELDQKLDSIETALRGLLK